MPMSDIGTGDVRGSSARGRQAIMYAHKAAMALIGKMLRRTVEWRQERVMANQRFTGGCPVYDRHVSCVKRRVNDGSLLRRPETKRVGSRPIMAHSAFCVRTSFNESPLKADLNSSKEMSESALLSST